MNQPAYQPTTAPSALRVQQRLNELNLNTQVVELTVAAKTAQQAADALGVALGQIAKSLIFEMGEPNSPQPLLIIASGDLRVNEANLAQLLNTPIRRAHPKQVREWTGYAIGGIPPMGHAIAIQTILDPQLRRFESVWAAGGTPKTVFNIETVLLFETLIHQSAQILDVCYVG
jgi:prolyl-tRNA editing enzyme YbaK/EbsC (Cys-tRNA(Pro) deacylase)